MPKKKASAPGSEGAAIEETVPKRVDFSIPPVVETALLVIKTIISDAGTQTRAAVDQSKVDEYFERIKEAEKNLEDYPLPPIHVFRTPEGLIYLADGFQRVLANAKAKNKEITCDIHEGTLENAIVYSLQANHEHGVPRSSKDLQRALKKFFEITPVEQVKEMTNTDIARVLRCSEGFVRNHRDVSKSSSTRKVTIKGKTRKTDTSGIGKGGGRKSSKTSKKSASNGSESEAGSDNEKGSQPDERTSLLISKIESMIGGREGAKIAEAIGSGAISVTPKELKEWAALSPKMAKAVAPLVALKGFKPYKAYEFLAAEPSDKMVEELHNRAIASEDGVYVFKGEGVKITVEHTGKK